MLLDRKGSWIKLQHPCMSHRMNVNRRGARDVDHLVIHMNGGRSPVGVIGHHKNFSEVSLPDTSSGFVAAPGSHAAGNRRISNQPCGHVEV